MMKRPNLVLGVVCAEETVRQVNEELRRMSDAGWEFASNGEALYCFKRPAD